MQAMQAPTLNNLVNKVSVQEDSAARPNLHPQHYIDGLKAVGGAAAKLAPHLQETFNINGQAHPHDVFNAWADHIHSIPSEVLRNIQSTTRGR